MKIVRCAVCHSDGMEGVWSANMRFERIQRLGDGIINFNERRLKSRFNDVTLRKMCFTCY